MELIEIRNNLIKLSYDENERPILGQFIALTAEDKSYVAQYINLKADNVNNFAVARLMFSFTSDGIVSEYDGSTPSIKSNIVPLPANELLDLLPVETPVKIGKVSGCEDIFNVDISIFEHNFSVFSENDYEKSTLISNCVRQLFRLKEKSVIIDNYGIFEDYPKLELGKDFKLPLNNDLIDYIFKYELEDVDCQTKAIIQDIFYTLQQYIITLDNQFLPIENFIDVVSAQYKETQMPELALLKNKLLKYQNANIFANDASEFEILEEKLKEKNCIVINIKNLAEELQKEIITYVHKVIETFDTYVYYFICLNDYNSDKKLLKRLLNHSNVFTTIFASHKYKYASELKSHAQNIMFFAPQTMEHDFAAYNTFLNKLNQSEGVIYGKLTQGIPLIISLDDLDLDLTREDVFGDRERFVPAIEEDVLTSESIYAINNLQELPVTQQSSDINNSADNGNISNIQNTEIENKNIDSIYSDKDEKNNDEDSANNISKESNIIQAELIEKEANDDNISAIPSIETYSQIEPDMQTYTESEQSTQEENANTEECEEKKIVVNPENVNFEETADSESESTVETKTETQNDNQNISSNPDEDIENSDIFTDVDMDISDADDLSFMEDFDDDENISYDDIDADELTEDDLDFIESENQTQNNIESTPTVVPIYDTEDTETDSDTENIGFKAGDSVSHPRYGKGVIEKIIKYGNKTLCSIDFENVGRRLLDPSVSDFQKL